MLCYRCGSHVPDTEGRCANCGQQLEGGGVRHITGTFSRRRLSGQALEGAPFKTGDVLAKRYTVRDAVGVGPLGYVFRVQDQRTEAELALKTVHPNLVQTDEERRIFARELQRARKLSHQNLVRVFDEGQEGEYPFFTMQFLEGLTLRKIVDLRIAKGNLFSVEEVEPILAQVCDALASVHRLGPHTDLKPENILVLPDLLKVSDVGLGLALPRPPFVQAQKQRRADRYIAPEYLQGGEIDGRVDLYALGVMLGEMLSGQTPEDAVPELSAFNPEVTPALEGFYRRTLNQNPLARPATAAAFLEELQSLAKKVKLRPVKREAEPALVPLPNRRGAGAAAAALVPRAGDAATRPPLPPSPEKTDPQQPEDVDAEATPTSSGPPGSHSPTTPLRAARIPSPPDRPPPPVPSGDDETLLVPSVLPPGPAPVEPELSGFYYTAANRDDGLVYRILLISLVFAGLLLGGAGGFWWLRTRQQQPTVHSATPSESLKSRPATPTGEEALPNPTKRDGGALDPRRAAALRQAEALRRSDERRTRRNAQEQKGQPGSPRSAGVQGVPAADEVKWAKASSKTAVSGAPECPGGMKLIPAGDFRMGTPRDDTMMSFDEKAPTDLHVSAFCIDQYEYPNRKGAMPLGSVSYAEAKRFCEARGRRLCSEEEWEKACKGPKGTRFPYGNTFDAAACNTEDETATDRTVSASGEWTKCRSGYGVYDLSGNLAEWTSSFYVGNSDRAQKGGAATRPDFASRCSARKNGSLGSKESDVGFRCCTEPGLP